MLARTISAAMILIGFFFPMPSVATGIDEIYVKPTNAGVFTEKISHFFNGKSYAIIIGVGDYDIFTKLIAPPSDALRVRDFLRDEEGFDYIVTLTDEYATLDRIGKLMEEDFPERVGSNDRFLFYFSGHGVTRTLNDDKRGYLVLKKAGLKQWGEMIDMPRIREWAQNISHARHTLFLLDACSSGLAAYQSQGDTAHDRTIERLKRPGHHMITAGVDNEETYSNGTSSLFTSAFLSVARGDVDPPKDGIISLLDIMTRVGRIIDKDRAEFGRKVNMTPHLYATQLSNNAGEFFFEIPNHGVSEEEATAGRGLGLLAAKGASNTGANSVAAAEAMSQKTLALRVFRDCPDCPEMVVLPAGRFTMGSDDAEQHWALRQGLSAQMAASESPQHVVTIQAFAIGKYEVTFDEWGACVVDGGCNGLSPLDHGWGRDDRPVINVTWRDAQAYISWLNGKVRALASTSGPAPYRLPSEAEWEYAARGGTRTRFWWGDGVGSANANCDRCGSQWDDKQTSPVGSFHSNPFGLYDMAGNVWQWTQDCWADNYVGAPVDGSANETGPDCKHVVRGGNWHLSPYLVRSAARESLMDYGRGEVLGFRVARTLPQ